MKDLLIWIGTILPISIIFYLLGLGVIDNRSLVGMVVACGCGFVSSIIFQLKD